MNLSSSRAIWIIFIATLGLLPLVFSSNLSLTLLSQMGIIIISCLSFNLLLGEGGMLSFGHAVYTGMGGYFTMHALNAWGKGQYFLPVTLLPLVGGVSSGLLAVILGFVSTRKSGTTFAMITLGTSELIASMALMFSDFFGGEAGLSGNRVTGHAIFGITYGPQIQVYYLIAFYCFISVLLMYLFTKTPLGKLLNAVRDNPSRVEFIGYNTTKVRWFTFIIAGFFAGIAGGLGAINFELVNSEVVGTMRSGAYIVFTYLGGINNFFGPILGAILLVLNYNLFSAYSKAWLLYVGFIFFISVLYLPGGIAGALKTNFDMFKKLMIIKRFDSSVTAEVSKKQLAILKCYLILFLATALFFFSVNIVIEMLYQLQLSDDLSYEMNYAGFSLNPTDIGTWIISFITNLLTFIIFNKARKNALSNWQQISEFTTQRYEQRVFVNDKKEIAL